MNIKTTQKQIIEARHNVDTSFDAAVKADAKTTAQVASLIAKTIHAAWIGESINRDQAVMYCKQEGVFVDGKEAAEFRRKFCNMHSAAYKALVAASEQKDADGKAHGKTTLLAVSGFASKMSVETINKAIKNAENLAGRVIKGIGALHNMGELDRFVLRRDGGFTVEPKGKDDMILSAAGLIAKAPNKSRGTQGEADVMNAAKGMNIKVLAIALSSKLGAVEKIDDLSQEVQEELATLMSVMLALQVEQTDDAGELIPVKLAS